MHKSLPKRVPKKLFLQKYSVLNPLIIPILYNIVLDLKNINNKTLRPLYNFRFILKNNYLLLFLIMIKNEQIRNNERK